MTSETPLASSNRGLFQAMSPTRLLHLRLLLMTDILSLLNIHALAISHLLRNRLPDDSMLEFAASLLGTYGGSEGDAEGDDGGCDACKIVLVPSNGKIEN